MMSPYPWYYPFHAYDELLLQSIHANNLLLQSIKELEH